MPYHFQGEEISESQLYDRLSDEFTHSDFVYYLNDNYDLVTVGSLSYGLGTVLYRVDPIAFNVAYGEELDFLVRRIQDGEEVYGFTYTEDE